jgi:L-rhamnose mutarotase
MRHLLMLDLRDDPELIARYEAHHRAVWPEVLAHLQRHGVRSMQIHRLGTRMTMVMETDDAVFDVQALREAEASDPTLRAWEDLMGTLQAPTPWTPAGQKWTAMQAIFDWTAPEA